MSDIGAKNGGDMFDVIEDDMDQYGLFTILARSNTANLGPVTGPIRNNLINNIISMLHRLSYKTAILAIHKLKIS